MSNSSPLKATFQIYENPGTTITNRDGNIKYMNPEHLAMFGISNISEILGLKWHALFPPSSRKLIAEQLNRNTETNTDWTDIVEAQTQSGETFRLALSISPMFEGGMVWTGMEHSKILAIKREKERQAEVRQEFLSSLAHELRTPLAALRGAHFLISKKFENSNDDKLVRYLDLQKQGILALSGIIDQVVLLNNLENDNSSRDLTDTNPCELVKTVVSEQKQSTAQMREIAVLNTLPKEFTISTNIDSLTAAIENIISNASKYSPDEGKIVVRIFLSEGNLCIETQDAGRGIPTGDQDKIFTPYFRASNVGSIPGAGLGLTIAKRAVERNGGKLNFSSIAGSGSIFMISIPVNRKTDNP